MHSLRHDNYREVFGLYLERPRGDVSVS
jgi:hypothetical protein